MNLKKGTPAFGILAGAVLTALGALVMLIGFWKTLILSVLFAVGYFLGAVDNKTLFIKGIVNRLVPNREARMIDLKSELVREQEQQQLKSESGNGHGAGKAEE